MNAGGSNVPTRTAEYPVSMVSEAPARNGPQAQAPIQPTAALPSVTTLFPSANNRAPEGFVDGSVETAAAFQITGLAEGGEAIFFVDEQANRVRRLWR